MSREDRSAGRLSSFVEAAAALEAELERFEAIAAAVGRAPLNSQKAIEHAARLTRDASEAQGRYAQRLQALVAMVGSTGERQHVAAATINDRVAEIDARTTAHTALERRLGELGEEARGINARAQGAIGAGGVPSSPERLSELIGALGEIGERMDAAVASALDIARDATASDFVDVARQADSLRQQLLATRNRVGLLRRGLAS